MKRRKFVAGLGALVSGAAATIGSGAFTGVSADRTVSVDVAKDARAFLKLEQRGAGRRSYQDGTPGTVGFDIPSPDEDDYGGTNPEGLGTDSVYRFARDAGGSEPGLFAAMNQGTQDVKIWANQPKTTNDNGDPLPVVDIFDVNSGAVLTETDRSRILSPGGDPLVCGLQIDTSGIPSQDSSYDIELNIKAAVVGT